MIVCFACVDCCVLVMCWLSVAALCCALRCSLCCARYVLSVVRWVFIVAVWRDVCDA